MVCYCHLSFLVSSPGQLLWRQPSLKRTMTTMMISSLLSAMISLAPPGSWQQRRKLCHDSDYAPATCYCRSSVSRLATCYGRPCSGACAVAEWWPAARPAHRCPWPRFLLCALPICNADEGVVSANSFLAKVPLDALRTATLPLMLLAVVVIALLTASANWWNESGRGRNECWLP